MPYRKQQFVNEELYHVILRGIDDNLIFKSINDYYRGIFSIYEFNDTKPTTIQKRREKRIRFKESRGRASTFADERDKLVDILAFCFMPNHLHLLLRQLIAEGIIKFMSKVGTGYAGYFNRKYNRKGYVFQNRFLAVPIKDDVQLQVVFVYIHINPLSLIEPGWKEKGIMAPEKAIEFLNNYKWSSYQDYLGKKNFPSVTERQFILEAMGGENGCQNLVEDWVTAKEKNERFSVFEKEMGQDHIWD